MKLTRPLSRRYCEMCDKLVAVRAKECPDCGALTQRAQKMPDGGSLNGPSRLGASPDDRIQGAKSGTREDCFQCDGEGMIGIHNCPRCGGGGKER